MSLAPARLKILNFWHSWLSFVCWSAFHSRFVISADFEAVAKGELHCGGRVCRMLNERCPAHKVDVTMCSTIARSSGGPVCELHVAAE